MHSTHIPPSVNRSFPWALMCHAVVCSSHTSSNLHGTSRQDPSLTSSPPSPVGATRKPPPSKPITADCALAYSETR
jgi:hypothetical protein